MLFVPLPGRRRTRRRPAPLVTVAGVAVGGLAVLPLVYLLIRAFDQGVGRVVEVASSSRALELLANTTALATAVTATAVAIAVPLAWVTVRTDLPYRRVWVVLTALPLAVPSYVGAFAFLAAAGPNGVVTGWLAPLGVQTLPRINGFAGSWLVLSLFTYPYVLLTVRAALRRLDPSLEEASRVLGQGVMTTMWRIVLPQLRPAIVAGALLVALYTLSEFGAVSMLRFDSYTRVIHSAYGSSLDRTRAAVFGLVLVAITTSVLIGEQRARRAVRYHRVHGCSGRTPGVVRLGLWRVPVLVVLSALVLLALAVPLAVVGTWMARGIGGGLEMAQLGVMVGNTLRAASFGAIATVAAALPVALLVVRRGGRLARVVEVTAWTGFALPGVVVALALVFFGARVATPLYQTMGMLTFAYAVLFLPQALGAVRAGLLQMSPTLEEAAALLGDGELTRLRRIMLPLLRPGILAGGALVFLTVAKELPVTQMLSPPSTPTLSTHVWSTTSEIMYSRAAPSALVLVLLSALPLVLLALREEPRARRPRAVDPEVTAAAEAWR